MFGEISEKQYIINKAKEYAQSITKNEIYQKYLEKAFIEGYKLKLE